MTGRDITCRIVAKGKNPLEMKNVFPVVDRDGRICGMVAQAAVPH